MTQVPRREGRPAGGGGAPASSSDAEAAAPQGHGRRLLPGRCPSQGPGRARWACPAIPKAAAVPAGAGPGLNLKGSGGVHGRAQSSLVRRDY